MCCVDIRTRVLDWVNLCKGVDKGLASRVSWNAVHKAYARPFLETPNLKLAHTEPCNHRLSQPFPHVQEAMEF